MSRNMSSLAITPTDILRFARDRAGAGVVLVTLVGIVGSSPRAVGAQMAVAADGSAIGSLSGGCIEAAIAAEALSALAANERRLVRFGKGSPYIDIRLPCGGGIDLLFNPRPDRRALTAILARLDAREAATMQIGRDHIAVVAPDARPTGWWHDKFHVAFAPRLRILAMGHGDALVAAARMAHFYGAQTRAFSPSRTDVAALSTLGIDAELLESRTRPPAIERDPWTALAFLFHEHEWEDNLLPWALRGPHFSISAIGGETSRRQRRDMLRSEGFAEAIVEQFDTPAGLIPATRDPAALALSIMAEIVDRYQRQQAAFPAASHPARALDPVE